MSEIAQTTSDKDSPGIDSKVFLPSLIIVLIAGVYLLLAPDHAEAGATAWKTWITVNFGWFCLWRQPLWGFVGGLRWVDTQK